MQYIKYDDLFHQAYISASYTINTIVRHYSSISVAE